VTTLLDLRGRVTFGPSTAPRLVGTVQVGISPPLLLTLTIDGTPTAMSVPRGVTQVCGFQVFLNGIRIPPSALLGPLKVALTMDANISTWSLQVALPSPFGDPAAYLGVPGGTIPVSLYGLYLTSTGIHTIPLIVDGIGVTEQRSIETDGTMLATIKGSDAMGRWDRARVTLALPPGHGFGRGQVIEMLALKAGATPGTISPGARMDHELVLVDSEWLPTAKELAAIDLQCILVDEAGGVSNPRNGFDPAKRIDFLLTKQDILRAARLTLDSKGDVVTRVIATGNAQVTNDNAGRHTEVQVESVYGNYAPKIMSYRQLGDGSLSSLGATEPPASRVLISRVETYREFVGTTLISEVVLSYQWFNPLSARYIQQADGTLEWVQNVFVPAGSVSGDANDAHVYEQERFVLFGHQETVYNYDFRGYLVNTTQRKDTPALGNAGLKNRADGSVAWTAAAFDHPRFLLGNKAGVVGLPSTYDHSAILGGAETIPDPTRISGSEKEIVSTDFLVTDDGFITRQTVTTSDYWVATGTTHLYSGGKEFAAEAETLQVARIDVTVYSADVSESGHIETMISVFQGQPATTTVKSGQSGYLPAATKSLDLIPDSSLYSSAEQADALAKAASRFQSQPIRATFVNWMLEESHPVYETTVSYQYAESPAELANMAQALVREGAASAFVCALAANFFLRPGSLVNFSLDGLDFLGASHPLDVYIRHVQHELTGAYGQVTTTISGSVYLVV
jgi:hypothetical protein